MSEKLPADVLKALHEDQPDVSELRTGTLLFVGPDSGCDAAKREWKSMGSAHSPLGFGYEAVTERHTKQSTGSTASGDLQELIAAWNH